MWLFLSRVLYCSLHMLRAQDSDEWHSLSSHSLFKLRPRTGNRQKNSATADTQSLFPPPLTAELWEPMSNAGWEVEDGNL